MSNYYLPSRKIWNASVFFRPAVYICDESGEFGIQELDGPSVPWISVDPLQPDLGR